MATQEDKTLVRRLQEEVFARGDTDVADAILTVNFRWHAPNLPPDVTPDRDGVKRYGTLLHAAYPDIHFTYDDIIADGDKVVTRWTARGTQTGALMGIPPTGHEVSVTGIDIFRVADGQVAELWESWDQLGMLQQLGVVPAVAAPAAMATPTHGR